MNPNPIPLPNDNPADFAAVETPSNCAQFIAGIAIEAGREMLREIEREKNREAGREARN